MSLGKVTIPNASDFMRPDMAKVIVERPRHGSRLSSKGKGYNRRLARISLDEQPVREGMKVRGGKGKSLNEHLAPLRRYLAGQVGQHWDKVFADICRYLDRNSAVQDHVRDHLDDYVATRVIICDGQLSHGDGYNIGRPLYSLFYVCPLTKILKINRRPRWRRFRNRIDTLLVHFVGEAQALVCKEHKWYMIDWRVWKEPADCPAGRYVRIWDVLLRTEVDHREAERNYGRAIVAVGVRLASKREIRNIAHSYPKTNLVR